MEPERRLADLDAWVGCWVAVKDGRVIAAASNSRDLVPELRKLGPEAEGAVAQFVTPPSDEIMVGVG
jgi:helix-turn-helix protein